MQAETNDDSNAGALVENPYGSPAFAPPSEPSDELKRPGRPAGVTILAILHGLSSVAMLGLFVVLGGTRDNQSWAQRAGQPIVIVFIVAAVCGALGLASSFGLWKGAKWGWWFAAWYYFANALSHGLALLATPFLPVVQDQDVLATYVITHSGRFVIWFLLALYIFRRKVMRFFDLNSLSKWKAVGILLALSAGLMLLMILGVTSYFLATRGLPPGLR